MHRNNFWINIWNSCNFITILLLFKLYFIIFCNTNSRCETWILRIAWLHIRTQTQKCVACAILSTSINASDFYQIHIGYNQSSNFQEFKYFHVDFHISSIFSTTSIFQEIPITQTGIFNIFITVRKMCSTAFGRQNFGFRNTRSWVVFPP